MPQDIATARSLCLSSLKKLDRSSYILNTYVPSRARDAYIAIRALNLETARITDSVSNKQIAKLRFEFWKSNLDKVFASRQVPNEPIVSLLQESLKQCTFSKRFLLTLLQSREVYVGMPPFRTIDSMAQYGEGIFSQLNYLNQEAILSLNPELDDWLNQNEELATNLNKVLAHIGQATGVASLLKAVTFYANKGTVVLPVDLMASKGISQEHFLNSSAEKKYDSATCDVLFETATRANDHLLTARSLFKDIKQAFGKSIPDAIYVPTMAALPTQLYLERLEKANFDAFAVDKAEWKLPWRSYRAYGKKTF